MTARPQVAAALYGLPGIPGGNEADQTAAVLRDLIGLTNHHY